MLRCRIAIQTTAARAHAGLARTGAVFSNGSGDYALAFSVAPTVARLNGCTDRGALANKQMSALFLAAIEAVEEAILNSLTMAVDTEGHEGSLVRALPLRSVESLFQPAQTGRLTRPACSVNNPGPSRPAARRITLQASCIRRISASRRGSFTSTIPERTLYAQVPSSCFKASSRHADLLLQTVNGHGPGPVQRNRGRVKRDLNCPSLCFLQVRSR